MWNPNPINFSASNKLFELLKWPHVYILWEEFWNGLKYFQDHKKSWQETDWFSTVTVKLSPENRMKKSVLHLPAVRSKKIDSENQLNYQTDS